jgi:hypothetical protein
MRKTKKVIYFLFYDQCIVNGGFFDNFEYYYIVKKNFPDCLVKYRVITDSSKKDVLKMLQDKYENIDPKVYNDIDVLPHIFGKFYRKPIMVDMIICATNSSMYWFLKHNNIQAAKSFIGMGDWPDINPSQNKMYKNSLTLYDERVFRYEEKTNCEPYRKKILFDKYRKKEFGHKYDYMLNMSLVERRFSREYMMNLFDSFEGTFGLYTGFKNQGYYAWVEELENVHMIIPPVEDFMGLFHTFIYVPYTSGLDATPRLIPECVFYGKGIEYYDNGLQMKSGGYYRYKDTKEDFQGLWLRDNDEVMEWVKKYLNL